MGLETSGAVALLREHVAPSAELRSLEGYKRRARSRRRKALRRLDYAHLEAERARGHQRLFSQPL